MINIVFEGIIDKERDKIIKKIKHNYSLNYTTRYSEDIASKKILNTTFMEQLDKELIECKDEKINVLKKDMLEKTSIYLMKREKMYNEKKYINFFKHNYFSYYVYYYILLSTQFKIPESAVKRVFDYVKKGEKSIDLLILFTGTNIRSVPPKIERKKLNNENVHLLKLYNRKIIDYVRYNNSEYKLIVIDSRDSYHEAIKKITNKIDEIITDTKGTEDEKWYRLYKTDVEEFEEPDDYIKYKLKYKKKFVKKIIKYSPNNKVIEMGCGTGLVAGYLARLGLDVTALDLSDKVLKYAKAIANQSSIISPCKYEQGDILNLKYASDTFDVAYSNGVLEHFNDEEIIRTLRQQMRVSNYVIFGIPSTYFSMSEKMLGNERGLTLKEWKNLIREADGELVEQTSFHYYKLYKRILEVKKWFKPKAFWLFIVRRKNKF